MYIYHVLINALSTRVIHINLNMIFYADIEHRQSYQNNPHKAPYGKIPPPTLTHTHIKKPTVNSDVHDTSYMGAHACTHARMHAHRHAHTSIHTRTHARAHTHTHTHTHTMTIAENGYWLILVKISPWWFIYWYSGLMLKLSAKVVECDICLAKETGMCFWSVCYWFGIKSPRDIHTPDSLLCAVSWLIHQSLQRVRVCINQ